MKEGLIITEIGKIVSTIKTWNPSRSNHADPFIYIDLSSIEQKEKQITGTSKILPKDAPSRARQLVRQGDVLVSTVRPNLNGVAYVPKEFDGATASTGFCILRPKQEKLDGRYLYHWVQTPKFVEEMVKLATGANYPAVSDRTVKDSQIPLPPLSEQKRIAAILDKADAIRRKRQQAIKLADDFLRATFLDMFGDPVTNPKGWSLGTIRELVSEVKYGTAKKASDSKGNYPILRMNNLTYKGEIDLTNLKYVYLEKSEMSKYLTQKGDILFNRTNSKELVGKTAVIESDTPMAIAGYLIRVRTNERATPHYISTYLNSSHGKKTLMAMCKSIVGMANINAQELQDIKIMIPPVDLQKQFSEIVLKLKTRIKRQFEAEDLGESLFSSLTQRAFRGEL